MILSDLIEAEEAAQAPQLSPVLEVAPVEVVRVVESEAPKQNSTPLMTTSASVSSLIDMNDKEAVTEDLDGVFVRSVFFSLFFAKSEKRMNE